MLDFGGINERPDPASAIQLIPKQEEKTGVWRRVRGGRHIYACKWEEDEETTRTVREFQSLFESGKAPKGMMLSHTGYAPAGRYGTLQVAFADGGRTRTGYAVYEYENVHRRWYYYLLDGPRPDTWFYYSFTRQNQAKTKGKYGTSEPRQVAADKLSAEKRKVCPYRYEYLHTTPSIRTYHGG